VNAGTVESPDYLDDYHVTDMLTRGEPLREEGQ
jgi:hypothetical protein